MAKGEVGSTPTKKKQDAEDGSAKKTMMKSKQVLKKRKVEEAKGGGGGGKKLVKKKKDESSSESEESSLSDKEEEQKKVKARSDSPWSNAMKGQERLGAVVAGLGRLFAKVQSREGLAEERERMVECLQLVARTTADPVRDQALKYADEAGDRWKQSCLTRPWKASPDSPATPAELLAVLPRIYQMERSGVSHDLKGDVQAQMMGTTTGGYTAKDYLGWDPVSEPPPDNVLDNPKDPGRPLSRHEALSLALRHSFYADRLGLSLGSCTYRDVLQWLPKMRPYKGPGELSPDDYRSQCGLVVAVVETLSDLGELRLPASLMPHEFLFVREHLGALIRRRDLLLVAQFVTVLHIFGSDDSDDVCLAGLSYVLGMEDKGSWEEAMTALKADEDDIESASLMGIKALLVHSPRGYGPGMPGLVPELLKWQRADADPEDTPPPKTEPAKMRSVPMFPSGEYDLRLQGMDKALARWAAEARKKVEVEEDDEAEPMIVAKPPPAAKDTTTMAAPTAPRPAVVVDEDAHLPVRERVLKLATTLETAREVENWRLVFESLKVLKKLPGIDRGVLESTKIGKVVGKLRKAGNEQVATLSRKIIERWKQMVETSMDTSKPASSNGSEPAPVEAAPSSSSLSTTGGGGAS